MKTTLSIIVSLTSMLLGVQGQVVQPATASAPPLLSEPRPGVATPYAVTERGLNSRVWKRVTWQTNRLGRLVPHTNSYTELATGLHYTNALGQLVESREIIEPIPGGAVARQGQHTVTFPYDLASTNGILLRTPDGQFSRTRVLGLSYFESTGKSVLLAAVTNCVGVIVPPNQVLYSNAFSGLAADVLLVWRRGSFSQSILLHESPAKPEAYGLSSASTRLEVLTEFLEFPTPTMVSRPVGAGTVKMENVDLRLGAMLIGRGQAFALGEENPTAKQGGVPVAKQFLIMDGRDVLVEQVAVPAVQKELDKLPPAASVVQPATNSVLNVVSGKRLLPALRLAAAASQPMQLAGSLPARQGYVLDYEEVNGFIDNLTFESGNTYLISGNVTVSDTLTIQGGSVIKFAENPDYWGGCECGSNIVLATIGHLVCPDDGTAVLTTWEDDGQGETIDGSSGYTSGGNSGTYLSLDVNDDDVSIQNLYFSFCNTAIEVQSYGGGSQVINCSFGDMVGICVSLPGTTSLTLANSGFYLVGTLVDFPWLSCPALNSLTLYAHDLSVNSGATLRWPDDNPYPGAYQGVSVTISNCCLADVSAVNAIGDKITAGSGYFFYSMCLADDWDRNGLPDGWETAHFGHTGVDPNGDPDGDGLTNMQEYLNGTDPLNYDSPNGLSAGELRVFTPLK